MISNPFYELDTVHDRHFPIRNDDGKRFGLKSFPRLLAVAGIDNVVAHFLELTTQLESSQSFVFGNQYAHASVLAVIRAA